MKVNQKQITGKPLTKPERCSYCGQRMEERVLKGAYGTAEGVTIWFKEYPVLSCPANHDRREIYPGFSSELMDSLLGHHKELFVIQKGLLKKRQYCPRCQEVLVPSPIRRRCSIGLMVRTKQGNVCSVKLSGEFVVCSGCRLTLIEKEVRKENRLDLALAHLLEKERVKGWGL